MSLYFIYGTLKKGMRNSHITKKTKAELISPCETTLPYPMFDLGNGFPYVQDKKGIGKILQGELYEIDSKYDKDLDYFEGVPTLYKRGTIEVEFENTIHTANCYFITDELDTGELNQVHFFEEWLEN